MDAKVTGTQKDLTVTFDQSLKGGTLNAANWLLYWNGQKRMCNTAFATADRVFCQTYYVGFTAKPNSVDYDPPPFDVMNPWLQAADAFYGYPAH